MLGGQFGTYHQVVLSWVILPAPPLGDRWQCLETFLTVTAQGYCSSG